MLLMVLLLMVAIGCSNGNDNPVTSDVVETVEITDPLDGRKFSQLIGQSFKKWIRFEYPEYWVHTSVRGDTTRIGTSVEGIYFIINMGNEHYHFHGTVWSKIDLETHEITVYRWPFDVTLYIGYESILLNGDDRWREVIESATD